MWVYKDKNTYLQKCGYDSGERSVKPDLVFKKSPLNGKTHSAHTEVKQRVEMRGGVLLLGIR